MNKYIVPSNTCVLCAFGCAMVREYEQQGLHHFSCDKSSHTDYNFDDLVTRLDIYKRQIKPVPTQPYIRTLINCCSTLQ